MALNLNLDGMEVYLNIKGYQKTNSENSYDTWCNVDFAFRFQGCIDYSMNDAKILLASEIENLEKNLTDLLEDKVQQTKGLFYFNKPGFHFEFYSDHKITDENPDVNYEKSDDELNDVSIDWIVYLSKDGLLTANYFSVVLEREDITQLRDYLRTILEA